MAKTTTITKPASKTAPKAAPKAATVSKAAPAKAAAKADPAAKAAAPVALAAFIVEGIAARIAKGSAFYARALSYHKDAGTVFPRARNDATRAALTMDDASKVFEHHDKRILPSGDKKAQAMFDVYMMGKA